MCCGGRLENGLEESKHFEERCNYKIFVNLVGFIDRIMLTVGFYYYCYQLLHNNSIYTPTCFG
jgi:hypothetical protein